MAKDGGKVFLKNRPGATSEGYDEKVPDRSCSHSIHSLFVIPVCSGHWIRTGLSPCPATIWHLIGVNSPNFRCFAADYSQCHGVYAASRSLHKGPRPQPH